MAIIRCTADGKMKLTPVTLQFQAGDFLQVQSGTSTVEPKTVLVVTGLFTLAGVSVNELGAMTLIDSTGQPAPVREMPLPHPRVPPPPPRDGALKFKHGTEESNVIKIVVDIP
jgi:hypothetical protein